jgi:hypothetical protein
MIKLGFNCIGQCPVPISSGIPVGSAGKRGPSTGVRVSAKRQKAPIVLSPVQVKAGLMQLEFRINCWYSLMAHWEHAEVNLQLCAGRTAISKTRSFQIQHSYYWRRGGILKSKKRKLQPSTFPCIQH